jgi:hypothetical protein
MNLFLLMERVDPSLMAKNEERIKRLENKVKAATSDDKKLTDKCTKLERDLTNLTTAVGTLRGKISKT